MNEPYGGVNGGAHPDFNQPIHTPAIRCFADVPDILTLDIPQIEPIVPALGIARNTITLWTGADGDGKTYLAQALAIALSRGDDFLGMRCPKTSVLYLDLENPGGVVQDRLRAMVGEELLPELRVWGIWNDQQPPLAGSELLLTIAKETRPVIIIDPFRYFHSAEENDSTAMSGVMQYLRACAMYGASVILLHHPAKAEGSTGRGSSVIRGACDLAFLHSLDKESQLITLKVDKNRHGESRSMTIRADFEEGRFEVADSPYVTRRNDELQKLEEIIKGNPGITQNGISKIAKIQKTRLVRLLNEGKGGRWHTKPGAHNSICYYHGATCSVVPEQDGTTEQPRGSCSAVPTPLGGNSGTAHRGAKDRLCSSHGFHDAWCQQGQIWLCAKCHQGGMQ